MKHFFSKFIKRFLGNPVFPALAIIFSVIIFFISTDYFRKPDDTNTADNLRIEAIKYANSTTEATTATTSAISTTSKKSTTAVSTTSVTNTTTKAKNSESKSDSNSESDSKQESETNQESKPESNPESRPESKPEPKPELGTKPEPTEEKDNDNSGTSNPTPSYDYKSAGDSPNSSFYQDRLVIIGDSIAYGYNVYGYIPNQHNIAAESLAVWNMGRYTFNLGGGSMGLYDAASYAYSPLYLISIGMNDIFTYSADDYGWNIRWIAEEILSRVPTATIVVGGITPVSNGNYYTTNDKIREYNSSLEWIINDMESSQVLYFNTHDVLCDSNTDALARTYAGGDGLHLNSLAYSDMLKCLFNYLDTTSAYDQILAHEGA